MSPSDSAFRQSLHPAPAARRPLSIAELADRAVNNLWDPSRGLKQWLRAADGFRKAGRSYADAGDLEAAFVEFAKAATIILEKLPTHKEYYTVLTATQRHNLGLNGQAILENLGELKPVLVDRYERWASRNPEEAARARAALEQNVRQSIEERDTRHPAPDESGWQAQEAARLDSNRRREVERRRDEYRYRTVDSGASESPRRLQVDTRVRTKEDVPPAVRRAPTISRGESVQDGRERETSEQLTPVSAEERRRERDDIRWKQEDTWTQEEEDAARRRPREQQGILRRQQEAEAASRAARYSINQPPTHVAGPSALNPQRSMTAEPPYGEAVPLPMPLESPTRDPVNKPQNVKPPSYPIPVTTTSPVPPDGRIRYPHLMSQHQLLQGYTPSLHSMFNYPSLKASDVAPSSLLFIPDSSRSSSDSLYSADILHHPSNVPLIPPATQRPPAPPRLAYPTLSRHPQGAPSSTLQHVSNDRYRTPSQESARIIRDRAVDDRVPELKTVLLPRDCLPRFLSIAALNTARNRETCGLLLGRDQNGKYVVTVLLIPKQHSTSDTCTMDEEELVMQFTEERSLITLGWIHTHPSQSCFMSSVDLHTHSGFQRMLPESFAVVCAPKSTPNFGIFRLTDPPGLQTILACDAKEAFHPHPDIPIYTDADKGHVQMKDLSLEIVDLR
ncbi:hypothetical protein BKA82DRAFT_4183466 [Pisolithus tinctorius]|nr:hypothetical protein BKA82DRAFT_4183466 [Pisolithus tinctorius]